MQNQVKLRARTGWQEEETHRLFSAVREASAAGEPLRSVFESLSGDLGRKPNSIRNYYYACLRQHPDAAQMRAAPFTVFTPEETHELLRQVLMARGQGMSVRSCVMKMANGDHSLMLRYQNKYRTLLKHRPELIESVREELKREGLPCPPPEGVDRADGAFCDPEDAAASRLMAEPCVSHMLEGLKELLRRAARAGEAADLQREMDRLQVRHDLRRIAWEKDFDEASAHLESLLCLLRDYLALPPESQQLQLQTFRDAALEEVGNAEAFLARSREG
ncbi:MAG: hypothetical protein IJ507_09375 [Clostridia bacterium]|nr:hypothetical protein [Clostridia bacterium]